MNESELQQREQKKGKPNEIGIVKIFLTALITSILTLGSSYILMFSQLEQEQQYWSTRMKTERLQEMMDRKIRLLEDVNSGILVSEVLAKDFKLESAQYMALLELSIQNLEDITNNKGKIINEKAVEYHKHINILASKLQMVELYFGAEVDSLLGPLSEAIQSNYQNNLILGDSIRLDNVKSTSEYFKRDFETVRELSANRLKIIKAMRDEIDLVAKVLYAGTAGK